MSDDAVRHLVAVAATCKKRNTPEWMAYFADAINAALAELGDGSRVRYPGSWSNEFHLLSGGGDEPDQR